MASPLLGAFGGARWYGLGWSKREALSRGVDVAEAHSPKPWRRTKIADGIFHHCLSLWNGADDERGVSVDVRLAEPNDEVSTFVVTFVREDLLRDSGIRWDGITAFARALTKALGGLTIVGSGDLVAFAERNRVADADDAVFAAFSGSVGELREVVVASTLDEALAVDVARLVAAIDAVRSMRGAR